MSRWGLHCFFVCSKCRGTTSHCTKDFEPDLYAQKKSPGKVCPRCCQVFVRLYDGSCKNCRSMSSSSSVCCSSASTPLATAKNAPTPPVLSHRRTTKTSPFDAGQLAPAATRKETFKRSLGSASASTPLVTAKKQKTTAVTTLSLSNESPGLHCSPGSILSFF